MKKNNYDHEWWLSLPFAEYLFFAALVVGALASALWSLYDLWRGNIMRAILLFIIWLVFFGWLALSLHKRRKVHFLISFLGAALVLIAVWFGILRGLK